MIRNKLCIIHPAPSLHEFWSLPDAPPEQTPCPICGRQDCIDPICPILAFQLDEIGEMR